MHPVARIGRSVIVEEGPLLSSPYQRAWFASWWAPLSSHVGVNDGALAHVFSWEAARNGAAYERDLGFWRENTHPLLPRVVDEGRESDRRFFATRAVVGVSLPVLLERVGLGALDETLAAAILADTAAVVLHLEARGAALLDQIVVDATLDLDGVLHAHTRVGADHRRPVDALRRWSFDRTLGFLSLPLGGRALDERCASIPAHATRRLAPALDAARQGRAADLTRALQDTFDLAESRAGLAALLAQVMPEEVRALRDAVDEAACVA